MWLHKQFNSNVFIMQSCQPLMIWNIWNLKYKNMFQNCLFKYNILKNIQASRVISKVEIRNSCQNSNLRGVQSLEHKML